VEGRIESKSLGIGAEIKSSKERAYGKTLEKLQPDDLIRFGLIPEFIERLPVVAVLDELTEEALIDILVKPKKCAYKAVQKTF
jgi:ATP-dependent Clp protease ATP-binding subunit ClpX